MDTSHQVVLYTTKKSEPTSYPIPSTLDRDYVIGILHDKFVLSQFFEQASPTIADKSKAPSDAKLSFSDLREDFALCKIRDGIVYTEKLPGGFTMSNVYTVTSGSGSIHNGPNPQIQLREERSVQALRPVAGLIKFDKSAPKKTMQLMRLFQELGRNGRNVMAALEVCLARYHDTPN